MEAKNSHEKTKEREKKEEKKNDGKVQPTVP
jgi:hypothetical protein